MMKKLAPGVIIILMLSFCIPSPVMAVTVANPVTTVATKPAESEEIQAMLTRLDEIKLMDFSKMSSSERKDLRKEVRSIKKNLDGDGRGIYLSAGAIIIIILLLILIL